MAGRRTLRQLRYRARVPAARSVPDLRAKYSSVQRLRLFALSLGITLAVFAQNSGSVAADTKLDLIVDPARFLRRSLSLWDPIGSAGQLQDQAYGYLFPMGPFFLIGHWLSLPPWVIQRCWESGVLIVAFIGMVRLARALAVTGFWPQVGSGLAYALAPRMLSELFSISSELLPVAVLPWLVLPLTRRDLSPRKAAALSGVALLFAGGINASATLAILPAPALYLLTRQRSPRRKALIWWWLLAVLLASLWWAIPLATLGKYSPPFLDWIESAAVTTTPTSLAATLRGVDHWLAYLGPTGWPAGWVLVVAPAAIVATGLVAAGGLAGIVRSGRDRAFLISLLLVGLILLTLGHSSGVGPPFALNWQRLLDGPANAFRNVHKFDPLVRLPIAIGIGRLLAGLPLERFKIPFPINWKPSQLIALISIALAAVAIGPVFGGNMVGQARPTAEASWWPQAAAWLAANSRDERALIVPGAGRPNLVWGQTVDDPLQPLAKTPWTVRDGLPLTQPGYIRFLDSIDQILARGEGDATLPVLLARAGVKYLVLRNDLDSAAAGSARLSFVHATLVNTPGLTLAAAFGSTFGGSQGFSDVTDQGLWPAGPAIQIFAVNHYAGVTGLQPVSQQLSATGSADSLATLAQRGLTVEQPVVFNGGSGLSVTTDGIRRREIVFGTADANPATLYADTPFALPRAAHDYLPANPGVLSTFRLTGVASVTASSSGDQVGAYLNRGAANSPYAAIDGDPGTAWRSSAVGGVGQWLQVNFAQPISPSGVRIAFAGGLGDFPTRLRVSTDAGTEDFDVANDGASQPLPVPTGSTSSLRITVLDMAEGGNSVGIAELTIPGVTATRTLQVPTSSPSPDVLAFDVNTGYRAECLSVSGPAACDPANQATGEEDGALDRSFTLGQGRVYHVAATVRLRPSAGLNAALDATSPVRARASSTQAGDPRVRAGAAVDGDPDTTWTAAPNDVTPKLTVILPASQRITGVRLLTNSSAPVSRPSRVQVAAGSFTWTGPVPAGGSIDFGQAVSTRTLTITILESDVRSSVDAVTKATQVLPTGISEVQPLGVSEPTPTRSFTIGCNAGLVLQVDGRSVPLEANVDVSAALAGQSVLAVPCGGDQIGLSAGAHRLRLAATSVVAPESITATKDGSTPLPGKAEAGLTSRITNWGSTSRTVEVHTDQAAYLVVRENFSAGWSARLNGHKLTPVLLDGWQQGYLIPAGSNGAVKLSFTPQRLFAAGLVLGALAVLALLWLAFRPESPSAAEAEPGRMHPVFGAILLAGAGFALLSLPGLILALAVLGLRRWWPWWTGPAVLGMTMLLVAIFPPGSAHSVTNDGLVQMLCGFAVLTAAVATGSSRPGRPKLKMRRSKPNQDTAATAVAASPVNTNNSMK